MESQTGDLANIVKEMKTLRSICCCEEPFPGVIRDDNASEHIHTKIPSYWQGRGIGQVSENANIAGDKHHILEDSHNANDKAPEYAAGLAIFSLLTAIHLLLLHLSSYSYLIGSS